MTTSTAGAPIVRADPAALTRPLGPYSQLSRVGDLVFVSGQTGIDADGGIVGLDVRSQTVQALQNVRQALSSQGVGMDRILKLTMFVAGVEHRDEFVRVVDELIPPLFPAGCPSNTLLVVASLASPDLLVEIEAVAHA